MKILEIKGKWFPVSNLVSGVLLADHRYGAEASVSFATDYYFDKSMYWGEMLAFKNNLKATCFINADPAYWKSQVPEIEITKKIHHDLYLMTDKWVNPVTGIYEVIPDYYSTTWTSLGKAVFPSVTIGASKPTGTDGAGQTITASRYPNHGQQLYDISGGAFGFDVSNNVAGTSNLSEFYGMLNQTKTPLESELGRKIISASYRNGITAGWHVNKNVLLGCRNSAGRISGAALTSYGFKQPEKTVKLGEFFYNDSQIATNPNLGWVYNHHLNRQNTIQYEASLTAGGAGSDNFLTTHNNFKTYLTTLINGNGTTIKNLFTSSGWFQEFTHWHNMFQGTGWAGTKGDIRALYEDYLAHLSSLLDGHFVFKGGYGEIVGYHSKRDSIVRIDLNAIGSTGVRISARRNDSNLDSLLNEPITVIVDFTGTSFANKEFRPSEKCVGIRKVSTNVFAVDLLDNCEILTDETGVYYDFTKPTGSATVSGTNITINSNIATKAVVYSIDGGGIVTEITRDNTLKTSRTLAIGSATNIKVGLVGELGESTLIEL